MEQSEWKLRQSNSTIDGMGTLGVVRLILSSRDAEADLVCDTSSYHFANALHEVSYYAHAHHSKS